MIECWIPWILMLLKLYIYNQIKVTAISQVGLKF